MNKAIVEIVLPTYNGSKYIMEQMESLVNQRFDRWRILVRDDGSNDGTLEILERYVNMYSGKIRLIQDEKGKLGVTNNVFEILKYITTDYVMFCDQDDVWDRDKVAKLYRYIRKKEMQYKNTPILVHSDTQVVDKDLTVIDESFTHLTGMNRSNSRLANLLQFNIVQGATAIFNRELLEYVRKLCKTEVSKKTYHDWWIALLASCFGKIFFYEESLMRYRQHGKNLVGVGYLRKKTIKELLADTGGELRITNYGKVNRLMCRKLLENYGEDLNERQKQIIEHFYRRPNDFIDFMRLGLYRDYKLKEIIFTFIGGIE